MGVEGDDRGWDGWMASLTQWTWVWVNSRIIDGQGGLAFCSSWGCKELGTTEWLNWTELTFVFCQHFATSVYPSCQFSLKFRDKELFSILTFDMLFFNFLLLHSMFLILRRTSLACSLSVEVLSLFFFFLILPDLSIISSVISSLPFNFDSKNIVHCVGHITILLA